MATRTSAGSKQTTEGPMSKHHNPWTYWVTMFACCACLGYSFLTWLLKLPRAPYWTWLVLLPLFYLDMIKRADADLAYQDTVIKREVRQAVQDALAERKPSSRPVDVAFETTEDVTISAGVAIVPAERVDER
jgi:hypothetical protein